MNDSIVHITIDGKEYNAEPGSTILGIINENGIEHPQICYVPEVDPIQTCDTCIVEVDGKLVRSCSTEADERYEYRTFFTKCKRSTNRSDGPYS